jgi:diadenosine tetraphosphate (Ap4A) HIT family hydrolase
MKPCPFCSLPQSRVIDSSPLGLVIRDAFPISPGHTLIIPKRHVGSFFELEADERAELLGLLDKAKLVADKEFSPQGYNIGINDGAAAGQTVGIMRRRKVCLTASVKECVERGQGQSCTSYLNPPTKKRTQ